jgi:RNA polymerase sigma-70 factor, ECF subfamily
VKHMAKSPNARRQPPRRRFADLVVPVIPDLRAFARFLARDADFADELVQETIAKALAAQTQFLPGTKLKAWLFTILRNVFYSQLRHRRRGPGFVAAEAAAQISVPPTQDAQLHFADLQRALSRLSDQQREALTLVGADGMSYQDAAAICRCSVGTLKSRVSRARAELLRLL